MFYFLSDSVLHHGAPPGSDGRKKNLDVEIRALGFYKLCSQIHNALCPLLIDQLLTVLSFYVEFAFDRDQ